MLIGEFIGGDCLVAKREVKVGKVLDVIVDLNRPKVIALIIGRDQKKINLDVLKIVYVIDGWNGVVWIKDRNNLQSIKKQKIIADIFSKGYLVVGRWALNKNFKKIGRVVDFNFDLLTGEINNFQIERGVGWWKQKRIIDSRLFIEINEKGVIFDLESLNDLQLRRIREVKLVVQ